MRSSVWAVRCAETRQPPRGRAGRERAEGERQRDAFAARHRPPADDGAQARSAPDHTVVSDARRPRAGRRRPARRRSRAVARAALAPGSESSPHITSSPCTRGGVARGRSPVAVSITRTRRAGNHADSAAGTSGRLASSPRTVSHAETEGGASGAAPASGAAAGTGASVGAAGAVDRWAAGRRSTPRASGGAKRGVRDSGTPRVCENTRGRVARSVRGARGAGAPGRATAGWAGGAHGQYAGARGGGMSAGRGGVGVRCGASAG